LAEKQLKKEWTAEFHKMDEVLRRGNSKEKLTDTKEANRQGKYIATLKKNVDMKIRGAKTRYDDAVKVNSFKEVSPFSEIFPEDWKLFDRVAADPAHELHNYPKNSLI
jgi:hypothetical protein